MTNWYTQNRIKPFMTKPNIKPFVPRTPGITGIGWLTGSRPSRIRLALWLSFSQACARICSACTDVRCAGVGRFWFTQVYQLFEHSKLVFEGRRSKILFIYLISLIFRWLKCKTYSNLYWLPWPLPDVKLYCKSIGNFFLLILHWVYYVLWLSRCFAHPLWGRYQKASFTYSISGAELTWSVGWPDGATSSALYIWGYRGWERVSTSGEFWSCQLILFWDGSLGLLVPGFL